MKTLFLTFLILMAGLGSVPASPPIPKKVTPTDPVENLIQKEKSEQEEWVDVEGDLPPMVMVGEERAFLVYSAANERARDPLLCTEISFDELSEDGSPDLLKNETTVNIARPRIREVLAESCMVRPGDPVVAIGPGWQELGSARDFLIRRERLQCKNDPPFSLWMAFDGPLPSAPLFFSTDIQLPVGENNYRSAEAIPTEQLSPNLIKELQSEVQFLDEYEVKTYLLGAPNCDRLVRIRKRELSPQDAELPNEALLTEKGGRMAMLLMEKVDPKKGSGRVTFDSVLDYNRDQNIDLVVRGDHQGCPFRVVFQGKESGFERVEIPGRFCSCR